MQDSLDYALMDAAWAGHEDSVLLLLRRGADVNARNDHSQETPLIYASQQGELAVVKILLDFDARPGLRPRNNEPALIRAVTMGYLDVAEELIRHGANVNQTGKLGRSALHYAATFGHYYIADMLLFYDARINFKAKYQVTAVMLAITSGYPEIAELLIRKGADLTISDSDGFTPLMLSAKYGYHKLTGLILKRYNQTEDTSRQNHTALSMAVAEGHITTTDTLLRNGANATHFITNNLSPITLTQIHGNDSLKALLKENGAKQNYKPFLDLAFFKYSISANPDDAIFGTHGGVHEIKSNTNISLGFSARYFAKRVMKKQQENLFHQYWERRYVIPLTIDKLFDLSKSYQKQLSLMAGLKTWYTWGRFRGVKDKPKDAFGLSPRAGIYWRSSGAFGVSIHYEYFNLKQQTVSPHRIILSFKLYHALYKKNLEPGKAEELSWY